MLVNCVFCNILKTQRDKILAENEEFFLIKPRDSIKERINVFENGLTNKDEYKEHYLIIPKICIENYIKEPIYLKKAIDFLNELIINNTFNFKAVKLLVNVNAPFQTVFHAHLHIFTPL